MECRERDEDGVHIVELAGEVDLEHSIDLREVLSEQAEAQQRRVLVDFAGVTYIDSSGLATLVEYMQKALKFDGGFALAGLNERLRTVFDLARLGEIFAIYPTLPEAKAALLGKA